MKDCFPCPAVSRLDAAASRSLEGAEARAKVLIADDDPIMHLLYGRQFDRAGYQVIAASNGREAIEVAQRELPDVVIMDIMMPEMDGLAAVRELKKAPTSKPPPIIIVTANPLYEVSRHESEQAGAALFMTKPFSPAHLLEQVHNLLSIREKR